MATNSDARRSLLMCLETSMQPVSVAIEVRLCFSAPELAEVLGLTDGCVKGDQWSCPKRPEEIREEDDFLAGELKLFRSVAAQFNFLDMDRSDLLYSEKELMRKMASNAGNLQIKYPRIACRYPWAELDSNIEVFGDANVAGCISTRKSTVGGGALWSGQ